MKSHPTFVLSSLDKSHIHTRVLCIHSGGVNTHIDGVIFIGTEQQSDRGYGRLHTTISHSRQGLDRSFRCRDDEVQQTAPQVSKGTFPRQKSGRNWR